MKTPVYLEIGSRRTFAGALEWPGWCRRGQDEASALQALLDYGPRYAAAVRPARLGFQPPEEISAFGIVERIRGDMTTDFGAPSCIPANDTQPVQDAELRRLQSILKACWRALDGAFDMAQGKTLRSGPRGGGRDLHKLIEHVLGADQAYLSKLGVKLRGEEEPPLNARLEACRQAILKGVQASAHGELAAQGPRGGAHWPARYFVRRSAWHVLDHAWEIEDRLS